MLRSVNPFNLDLLGEWPYMVGAQVRKVLEDAQAEFSVWSRIPLERRMAKVRQLAQTLIAEREELALIITDEIGKPLEQSRAEVDKSAWACRVFADQAVQWLGDEVLIGGEGRSYVTYRPLGVILAIMPWNFPLWQIIRCAVPALLTGNTVLFKPAPNVTMCAKRIADIFVRSGFAHGAFQLLLVDNATAERVLAQRDVRGLSFTGSTETGRHLARLAASHLKKAVLELGGSDPYLILEDADLDLAVEKCVQSRLQNSGQSCVAAKRFIVERPVLTKFTTLLKERVEKCQLGSPREEPTQVGPLARRDLVEHLRQQVEKSVAAGAQIVAQATMPEGKGYFFVPTLLSGVRPGMAVADEETFGPVFPIIEVADEVEAIQVANQSSYGLGAAVFTTDHYRGEFVASHLLEVGTVAVNDYVRSDPRSPFGGVKDSGLGRELGRLGFLEFTNAKSVCL